MNTGVIQRHLPMQMPAFNDILVDGGKINFPELLEMRARLLRLMFKLTTFADARAAAPNGVPISPSVREAFSRASHQLQTAAQAYQRIGGRAAALAINGAIFSAVNIEFFGIQPTTYRAPYTRRGEGKAWV